MSTGKLKPAGTGVTLTWPLIMRRVTMSGYAGPLRPVRPVRRLPARAGRAGAGGRPGAAAGPAGDRGPGGPYGGVPDGPAGMAGAVTPAQRTRVRADPEGGPAAGRGRRPDLPDHEAAVGRALRPDRAGEPATPLGPVPDRRQPRLPGLRLRGRADLVGAARARGGGRAADRGRRALRPVHRRSRRRCRRDAVTGGTRVGPARARRRVPAVRRRHGPAGGDGAGAG